MHGRNLAIWIAIGIGVGAAFGATYAISDGRGGNDPATGGVTVDPDSHRRLSPDDRVLPAFLDPADLGASSLPAANAFIGVACGESLSNAMNSAMDMAHGGRHVRVTLAPCVYRETLAIHDMFTGSIEVAAEVPHTAIISGADVFENWTLNRGAWATAWPYHFGLSWPSDWPSSLPQNEVLKRTETFFVDGVRQTQVTRFRDLVDGSFFIDEGKNKVFIKTTVDPNFALVEGTVRLSTVQIERAANVVLRDLVQEKSVSDIQSWPGLRLNVVANVLLENLIIRDNSGMGMAIFESHGVTTRHNQILANGYQGVGCFRVSGLLSEDDTISGSNWRGSPFGMTGWAIAGLKCARIHDSMFRRLTITDNLSRGFWLDIDIERIAIDDPIWDDNDADGAFLEKIRGPMLIRGGDISNNGGAGVLVSASTGVTIDGVRAENNSSSQIYFSGDTNVAGSNWETGESYVLNTDSWTVVNSTFRAFGSQMIVGARLPPKIMWAENNVCSTDNPMPSDGLVCD